MTESPALTRRDRMRATTMGEITATARRLLVEQGPEGASLRAIAREMGMTAPGLYRYFSSREELLRHVIATIFRELADDIRRAIGQAARQPGDRDPRAHMTLKMIAACQEFRHWGLSHKDEFAMVFGVPLPWLGDDKLDIAQQCAMEFATTFYALYIEVWNAIRFPVPGPEQIDPGLRAQLDRLRPVLRTDAPEGVLLVFLRCWILLYGAVAMEVFDHLRFALEDPAPMFELTLSDLARLIGLEYPIP